MSDGCLTGLLAFLRCVCRVSTPFKFVFACANMSIPSSIFLFVEVHLNHSCIPLTMSNSPSLFRAAVPNAQYPPSLPCRPAEERPWQSRWPVVDRAVAQLRQQLLQGTHCTLRSGEKEEPSGGRRIRHLEGRRSVGHPVYLRPVVLSSLLPAQSPASLSRSSNSLKPP